MLYRHAVEIFAWVKVENIDCANFLEELHAVLLLWYHGTQYVMPLNMQQPDGPPHNIEDPPSPKFHHTGRTNSSVMFREFIHLSIAINCSCPMI